MGDARRVAVVTTTIHVPTVLRAYVANAEAHGHGGRVVFVVAGDLNTPPECAQLCAQLQEAHAASARFVYLSADAQEAYLLAFPELALATPWRCIQRRNVAWLWALDVERADVLITIDDDNAPLPEHDFIGEHLAAGAPLGAGVEERGTGQAWYNVCELLTERRGVPFYPRGFPLEARWRGAAAPGDSSGDAAGVVAVNAGLWLGDPDVDAFARLAHPLEATAYTGPAAGVVLANGTWCPFNSQNTALSAAAAAAYCVAPRTGRYDDILPSFALLRIAGALGQRVRFGGPLVRQARNEHDLLTDHDAERAGLSLAGPLCAALRALPLDGGSGGRSYGALYDDVRVGLRRGLLRQPAAALGGAAAAAAAAAFVASADAWAATMRRAAARAAQPLPPPPPPRTAAAAGRVSMSALGAWGQFGNQVFQYFFLRVYAAARGWAAETPPAWPPRSWFPAAAADALLGPDAGRRPLVADRVVLSHPAWVAWARGRQPLAALEAEAAGGGPPAPLSHRVLLRLFPQAGEADAAALWVGAAAGCGGSVDIHGWFQFHTAALAPHRDLFYSLFEPIPPFAAAVGSAMALLRGGEGGRRPVMGVHLRLLDYAEGEDAAAERGGATGAALPAHTLPGMGRPARRAEGRADSGPYRPAPLAWYEAWLAAALPRLAAEAGEPPALLVASNDPAAARRALMDMPCVAALGAERVFTMAAAMETAGIPDAQRPLPLLEDWLGLAACDALALSNSTFGFSAAMLARRAQEAAADGGGVQRFARPCWLAGRLVPFDPWAARPVLTASPFERKLLAATRLQRAARAWLRRRRRGGAVAA